MEENLKAKKLLSPEKELTFQDLIGITTRKTSISNNGNGIIP